jgi:hypothetical protein
MTQHWFSHFRLLHRCFDVPDTHFNAHNPHTHCDTHTMVATSDPPVGEQQQQPATLPELRLLKVPAVETAFQVRRGGGTRPVLAQPAHPLSHPILHHREHI